MAKGKQDHNLKKKALEWESSGKSCMTWCREHKILYTTLCGWRKRFRENKISKKPEAGFIELKDQRRSGSGTSLELKGITIHLDLSLAKSF